MIKQLKFGIISNSEKDKEKETIELIFKNSLGKTKLISYIQEEPKDFIDLICTFLSEIVRLMMSSLP